MSIESIEPIVIPEGNRWPALPPPQPQLGAESEKSPTRSRKSRAVYVTAPIAIAFAFGYGASHFIDDRADKAAETKRIERAIEHSARERGLAFSIEDYSELTDENSEVEIDYGEIFFPNKILKFEPYRIETPAERYIDFGDDKRCRDNPQIVAQVTPDYVGGVGTVDIVYTFFPKADEDSAAAGSKQHQELIVVSSEDDMRDEPYFADCFPETGTSN